ncbi:hypothetical protein K474DRAFT_1767559 [Panus rudis PR-1116 ss-1]|nr:hypothetical protein K474DRAFT_1767559 [Panus rudis PR-1116 ss-1]
MPLRRCHWFDDVTGKPLVREGGQIGCTHPHCAFVHPSDKEWSIASSSNPKSVLQRSRSASNQQTTNSSLRHIPQSSVATAANKVPVPQRPPTKSITTPSATTRLPERDPAHMTSTPAAVRTISEPSGSRIQSVPGPQNNGTAPPQSRSNMPPPPSPRTSSAPTTQPPPAKPPPEVSGLERRDAWVERIKLISDAVNLRLERRKLDQELKAIERMSKAWGFQEIDAEDKGRFARQQKALEDALAAKKKELNAVLSHLVDTNFWPVNPQLSESAAGRSQETQMAIQQLKDSMQELRRMIASYQSLPPPPKLQLPTPEPSIADDSEAPRRPAKRPRLSPEVDAQPSVSTSSVPASHSANRLEDDDDIREQLSQLEGRLVELEDNLVHNNEDILMELEERVKAHEEIFHQGNGPGPSTTAGPSMPSSSEISALSAELSGRLLAVENGLGRSNDEVGQLIGEVADIITSAKEHEAEVKLLKEENVYLRAEVARLEAVQEENKKAIAQNTAQIESLHAAVSALLKDSAQPPAPLPTAEELILSSYPVILKGIQQDLQPMLTELHKRIQEALDQKATHLSNTVMAKLASTLQTIEAVAAWLNHVKQSGDFGVSSHPFPVSASKQF